MIETEPTVSNRMLADKIEHSKNTKEMLHNTPAAYKKDFPFLKEVYSLAHANARLNLQQVYKNFFRYVKIGFPKFKSKHDNTQSYTTDNYKGTVAVGGKYIKLPQASFSLVVVHYDKG